jgi:hypothetical protein
VLVQSCSRAHSQIAPCTTTRARTRCWCSPVLGLIRSEREPEPDVGRDAVDTFLTHLAIEEHVSAPMQNQALASLLFLYVRVLDHPWRWCKWSPCSSAYRMCAHNTKRTSARAEAGSSSRTRSSGSIPTRGANGRGNGCSPRVGRTVIPRLARCEASSARERAPARCPRGRGARRDLQASGLSRPASLVRHASAGEWIRHPNDPANSARPSSRDSASAVV